MNRDDLHGPIEALPREIAPSRDLWPDIRAGIRSAGRGVEGGRAVSIASGARARTRSRAGLLGLALAAAIAGLWVGGSSLGWLGEGGGPAGINETDGAGGALTPAASPSPRGAPDFASVLLASDDPALEEARRMLAAAPSTRFAAAPLATLDSLVAEAHDLLLSSPRNVSYARQLAELRRRREGVVHQALRVMIDSDR